MVTLTNRVVTLVKALMRGEKIKDESGRIYTLGKDGDIYFRAERISAGFKEEVWLPISYSLKDIINLAGKIPEEELAIMNMNAALKKTCKRR